MSITQKQWTRPDCLPVEKPAAKTEKPKADKADKKAGDK